MNKQRLLWVLVAADVLLAFGSVGAEGFFGWTLPPALADFEHARFSSFSLSSPESVIHLLMLAATVLCAFAAWIGLVSLQPFARRLYLVSIAMSMLLILVSGPSVRTQVGGMFRAMSELVSGAILGLVYFSDLAHRFERPSAPRSAPTETNAAPQRA